MPRRFDALAALQRRIAVLEARIAKDQAELAQHREALKVYQSATPPAAPKRRPKA